jgi:hypothetical protein
VSISHPGSRKGQAEKAKGDERRRYRVPDYDRTQTANHLLLNEIADAEAQQRLVFNEELAHQELESKRQNIKERLKERAEYVEQKSKALKDLRQQSRAEREISRRQQLEAVEARKRLDKQLADDVGGTYS